MPPKRQRRRMPRNPYGGGNPMPGMVRDINRTALGITGIGAVTFMGTGVLGALKK